MVECVRRMASLRDDIFADSFLVKARRVCDDEWIVGNLLVDQKDSRKMYVGRFYQKIEESEKERTIINDLDVDEVIPETICRCSGKRDIDGNLIFENDKIKANDYIGVVRYGEYAEIRKELGWYIKWTSENAKFIREDFLFWQEKKIRIV